MGRSSLVSYNGLGPSCVGRGCPLGNHCRMRAFGARLPRWSTTSCASSRKPRSSAWLPHGEDDKRRRRDRITRTRGVAALLALKRAPTTLAFGHSDPTSVHTICVLFWLFYYVLQSLQAHSVGISVCLCDTRRHLCSFCFAVTAAHNFHRLKCLG